MIRENRIGTDTCDRAVPLMCFSVNLRNLSVEDSNYLPGITEACKKRPVDLLKSWLLASSMYILTTEKIKGKKNRHKWHVEV